MNVQCDKIEQTETLYNYQTKESRLYFETDFIKGYVYIYTIHRSKTFEQCCFMLGEELARKLSKNKIVITEINTCDVTTQPFDKFFNAVLRGVNNFNIINRSE